MIDGRQLGRQYGASLGDYGLGLKEIETAAQEKVESTLKERREELARLRAALEKARAVCDTMNERIALLDEGRKSVVQRREGSPAQFSLIKGLLYLGLSFLLILADISILGQVIARFLGYSWRDRTGRTFAQLIFNDIPRAFREFPDLFCLTIAILLISFFIKLWRDSYFMVLTGEPRRIDRAEFAIYSIMLLLALAAVIAMAMARLTMDVGGSQGWATRIVSTLLGLALPIVSAGFFLKGYDSIADRWELWRLSTQQVSYSLLNWSWQSRMNRLNALMDGEAKREAEVPGSAFRDAEIAALRSAFSQGYREGMVTLFSDRQNLTEKLKPLVIARFLAGKRR